jgi:hypothetical protein
MKSMPNNKKKAIKSLMLIRMKRNHQFKGGQRSKAIFLNSKLLT